MFMGLGLMSQVRLYGSNLFLNFVKKSGMKAKASIFFIAMLFSCIGVDRVDDPLDLIMGNTIKFVNIENNAVALMLEDSYQVQAVYFDKYGLERIVPLTWESSNEAIVQVSNGQLTAEGVGVAMVVASFEQASLALQVNVVEDETAVASVVVEAPLTTMLSVGQTLQLEARVLNISGESLPDKEVEWFAENTSILSVSALGLLSANANGVAEVHAKSEGVKSNSIIFSVGAASQRTGQFVSAGGYQARGTAILKNVNNELILELGSDFETSFALGTFVYLANSTSGSQVKAGGFEVAQITTNGAKTFNISNLNASITLAQYKYVVILCKPASVSFGYAEMK